MRFEELLNIIANSNLSEKDKADYEGFIKHEIELLSRKASKSATLTPAQKDAIAVSEIVKDILAECPNEQGMTVGAILKDSRVASYTKADGNSVSSQMLTAIFTKNPKDFVRTVDKKVAYYSLAYGEVAEGEGEGE
jgi:hypothetical protein